MTRRQWLTTLSTAGLMLPGVASVGCDNIKHTANAVATKTQPPVQVTTTPFLILKGCYVNVSNTSATTTLTGVEVTYTGPSGNTKSQMIGTLKPNETKTLDPSDVRWTVEKHETITVAADNYLSKTLDTNILIK